MDFSGLDLDVLVGSETEATSSQVSLVPETMPRSARLSNGLSTSPLGYSRRADTEPLRCHRRDGKKWRCSRGVVPDMKNCERHINRFRNRSKKRVEGPPGEAASETTNLDVVPTTSSMSTSATSGDGPIVQHPLKIAEPDASNPFSMPTSLTSGGSSMVQRQLKISEPGAANPSTDALVNRAQDANESDFSIPKQDIQLEESFEPVFRLDSADSLHNLSERSSIFDSKSYGGSFLDLIDQEFQDQLPFWQLVQEFSNDEFNRSAFK